MSDLSIFVLAALRQAGAIIDPPAYGVYDVLLPEPAARRLGVGEYLRLAFEEGEGDGAGQDERAGVTLLGYGHPLVETLAEQLRTHPANARAYLNDVRLDKHGLLELGRKELGFPNARLEELPREVERPALGHYVRFNFKAALITDEKREQLVSVWMDVQGGHAAHMPEHLSLADEPAFGALPAAPVRWLADAPPPVPGESPLSAPVLSGLLERATRAVLDEMAEPLARLRARAAHFLELDRARLQQYYDDTERSLERRVQNASPERLATLEGKLAATRAERRAKLADVEAKYRLRVELELINLLLVAQPKVLLPVRIANRNAQTRRSLVWDPLQHRLEPLVCDVCGLPGTALHLCTSGHLAHEACLLPEQCIDCKRVFCQLCANQMDHCVVCSRPVCRYSLIRCKEGQGGTCREHEGLCQADARPAEPAQPQPKSQPEPSPPPAPAASQSKSREAQENKKKPEKPDKSRTSSTAGSGRRPAQPAAGQRAPARPAGITGHKIEVEIDPNAPAVTAYVLSEGQKQIAVRRWELQNIGIGVWCHCEKGPACPEDNKLHRPAGPEGIRTQLREAIEDLRQEYQVSTRRVTIYAFAQGETRRQLELNLRGAWRDPETLARARAGHEVARAIQFPWYANTLPLPAFVRQVDADNYGEVGSMLKAMRGLLLHEGVLEQDKLLARVANLVRPGPWYTPRQGALLIESDRFFLTLRGGLVALPRVEDPQALVQRKRELGLPPRDFTLLELLEEADPEAPLAPALRPLERKLARLGMRAPSVREIQREARYQPSPEALAKALAARAVVLVETRPEKPPEKQEETQEERLAVLRELWQQTPRHELRGRTPTEAAPFLRGETEGAKDVSEP